MASTTVTHIIGIGLEGSFYIVTLIFVGFSLSIAYHLLAYGTNKAKSFLMLAVYLGVSAFLFLSMFITLTLLT
jgi:hypothetical protein